MSERLPAVMFAPRMRRERSLELVSATTVWRVLAGSAVLCVLTSAAEARPARCFTTEDGTYACQFVAPDRQGSFRISAPGKPTVLLRHRQLDWLWSRQGTRRPVTRRLMPEGPRR